MLNRCWPHDLSTWNWVLTPRSWWRWTPRSGWRRNYHKGRAAIRHYANQRHPDLGVLTHRATDWWPAQPQLGVQWRLVTMGLVTSSLLSLCVNPGAETRADTHTITRTSAANRSIGEVVQSRRRPLLGPSPGWKQLLPLSHLRHAIIVRDRRL